MEEEARKLLEEGIKKKLISPGKGELSSFPNGTKVNPQRQCLSKSIRLVGIGLKNTTNGVS